MVDTEASLWTGGAAMAGEESGRVAALARAWAEAESTRRAAALSEEERRSAESAIEWAWRSLSAELDQEIGARVDELSQMIVHELKNPLSQVQVGVEMMARRAELLGDEERMYLGWMLRGVARAVQVLDDVRVLGLSEASQGGARWVPIEAVVKGVLARVREEADHQSVTCRIDGEIPSAQVDGAQVGMALGNLVSNAVKYSDPSKPERWVRVHVERVTGVVEGWRFTVADNGLGIPARMQRDVFRRHFRAHPGAAEGMGLGLSIARQVIERRHGHIWFHSEERKGTVFHFVIPDQPGRIPPDLGRPGEPPPRDAAP